MRIKILIIIIFNAKNSQYFGSNPSNDPCTVDLTMLNGQSIQYVKKCIHLGNEQEINMC